MNEITIFLKENRNDLNVRNLVKNVMTSRIDSSGVKFNDTTVTS